MTSEFLCDVFLSGSAKDKAAVRVVAECLVAALTFVVVLACQNQVRAADEYMGSLCADGTVFSEVIVRDHLFVIPFPNVHGPLALAGGIDSWLLRWQIANLKTNQQNDPEQVFYLAHQQRTGEMAYGFLASGSANVVACNSSKSVDLYSILPKKPARLMKSIPADDPVGTSMPVRIFSRSQEYFFLWKPAPAIYAVSNSSVVMQLKDTDNFKKFEADVRREGGGQESLSDDLKYLIHVSLEFTEVWGHDAIDSPHCYNLETDEYTKLKIHAGTNRVVIVSAESLNGSPSFIAFWEPVARGDIHDAISIDDIDDVDLLANRLKQLLPSDRVSLFVRSQLSPATESLLSAHPGGPNPLLKEALVADMERIVKNGRIYDRKRFAGVDLSDFEKEDIDDGGRAQGTRLVQWNRKLLRAAYSREMWQGRYKHLGIFDANSTLLTELPKQGTRGTQFENNCCWDYAHSNIFIREADRKLTIYNYKRHQMQHFSLANVVLKVP